MYKNCSLLEKGPFQGFTDYASGLCWGVLCGSKDAAVEFGPATINSCQGLLRGLWAFACAPVEVSQDLIDTSKELIHILREQSAFDSLQMVVPEFVRTLYTMGPFT